jgi:twitching motility protein PilT
MADDTPTSLMDKKLLNVRERHLSVGELLGGMGAVGASDLFLKTGAQVKFKIEGRVATFQSDLITKDVMDHVIKCFLNEDERTRFATRMSADVVYATSHARYRVHLAYGQTGPYAAIRVIGTDILPFPKLGLPAATQEKLLGMRRGLVVICGTTDAGKTVTCTSLLEHFNQTTQKAILTLEDPIEYVLVDKQCLVIQREVGSHIETFADGIRSALRENVDVIFVGEVRDPETIEQCLRAAEMGHLVITSLHAEDPIAAITRLIGSFPPNAQPRIKQALASTLVGVVFQRLLPRIGGGRVPCVETMWVNTAVRTILRIGDLSKLNSYVGKATGGIGYREYLQTLARSRTISTEVHDAEMARINAG